MTAAPRPGGRRALIRVSLTPAPGPTPSVGLAAAQLGAWLLLLIAPAWLPPGPTPAPLMAVQGAFLAALFGAFLWLTRHDTFLHPNPKGSPMSEEYDLDAIVAQRREAVGGDEIVFTWAGDKFHFPHPLLAADEWKETCADADPDDVSQVQAMLGEEQYDRFHELGGQAGFVMLIVQQVQNKLRDEMSDGRPTRRSTSSGRRRRR